MIVPVPDSASDNLPAQAVCGQQGSRAGNRGQSVCTYKPTQFGEQQRGPQEYKRASSERRSADVVELVYARFDFARSFWVRDGLPFAVEERDDHADGHSGAECHPGQKNNETGDEDCRGVRERLPRSRERARCHLDALSQATEYQQIQRRQAKEDQHRRSARLWVHSADRVLGDTCHGYAGANESRGEEAERNVDHWPREAAEQLQVNDSDEAGRADDDGEHPQNLLAEGLKERFETLNAHGAQRRMEHAVPTCCSVRCRGWTAQLNRWNEIIVRLRHGCAEGEDSSGSVHDHVEARKEQVVILAALPEGHAAVKRIPAPTNKPLGQHQQRREYKFRTGMRERD